MARVGIPSATSWSGTTRREDIANGAKATEVEGPVVKPIASRLMQLRAARTNPAPSVTMRIARQGGSSAATRRDFVSERPGPDSGLRGREEGLTLRCGAPPWSDRRTQYRSGASDALAIESVLLRSPPRGNPDLRYLFKPAPAIAFASTTGSSSGDLKNLTGETKFDDRCRPRSASDRSSSRHVNVLSDLKTRETIADAARSGKNADRPGSRPRSRSATARGR